MCSTMSSPSLLHSMLHYSVMLNEVQYYVGPGSKHSGLKQRSGWMDPTLWDKFPCFMGERDPWPLWWFSAWEDDHHTVVKHYAEKKNIFQIIFFQKCLKIQPFKVVCPSPKPPKLPRFQSHQEFIGCAGTNLSCGGPISQNHMTQISHSIKTFLSGGVPVVLMLSIKDYMPAKHE